jgi:hypothetical protein
MGLGGLGRRLPRERLAPPVPEPPTGRILLLQTPAQQLLVLSSYRRRAFRSFIFGARLRDTLSRSIPTDRPFFRLCFCFEFLLLAVVCGHRSSTHHGFPHFPNAAPQGTTCSVCASSRK